MQTTEQARQQAVVHHQAGDLQEAEMCYRAILDSEPLHSKANHNLGTIYVQQPAAGLPFFAAVIEANPAHGQYWLSYIDALHQAGQLEVARLSGLQGEDVDAIATRLHATQTPATAPRDLKLDKKRGGLRQRVLASPIFDAARFARYFEQALWDMRQQRRESRR